MNKDCPCGTQRCYGEEHCSRKNVTVNRLFAKDTRDRWTESMAMKIVKLSEENLKLKKKLKEYEEFGTPKDLDGLIRLVTEVKALGEVDYIFQKIVRERIRQDEKWGEQNHEDSIWSMILGEEVGEVQKAAYELWEGGGNSVDLTDELIQVAAVAIAWYQCIQRKRTKSSVLY